MNPEAQAAYRRWLAEQRDRDDVIGALARLIELEGTYPAGEPLAREAVRQSHAEYAAQNGQA